MSKAPDRPYLRDAINIIELTHLFDEQVPAVKATVEHSNATVFSAKMELDNHQLWLERHRERYAEALKWCKRKLKHRAFISGCKKTAWLPIQLLASAGVSLFAIAWAYPRRVRLLAKLQNRLHAMEEIPAGKRQNPMNAMEQVPQGKLQGSIHAMGPFPPAKLQNRIHAMDQVMGAYQSQVRPSRMIRSTSLSSGGLDVLSNVERARAELEAALQGRQ
jgi:hypothetical protein